MARSSNWSGAWRGLSRRRLLLARIGLAAAFFAALGLGVSCLDGGSDAPPLEQSGYDGGVVTGACDTGDVAECSALIGEHNGVRTCVYGTQICTDDKWGPCEGTYKAVSGAIGWNPQRNAAGAADDTLSAYRNVRPMALSDASACNTDPCDPTCQTFDEVAPDGGITMDPNNCAVDLAGGTLLLLPGGFQNKLLVDVLHPPDYAPCSSSGMCQIDHYCDQNVNLGTCVPYNDGEFDANETDPNFTLRTPCGDQLIACNRGGGVAPSGAKIIVVAGNSVTLQNNLGKCTGFDGTVTGSCTTTSAIQPGECISVSGCEAFLTGTTALYINSTDHAPPHFNESDCADNWAVHGTEASADCGLQDLDYPQSYPSACEDSQRPQWGYLAYESTVPLTTSISLSIHTADPPNSTMLSSSPCTDCIQIANITASEPASCPMSGPSPCPIDLYEALGGLPQAQHRVVELVWSLTSSPGCAMNPTLTSWQLTYSCVDVE